MLSLKRSVGVVRPFSFERQSALQLTHSPILESLEEDCMTITDSRSQTFVEWVLALLEERFPWLGKEDDEQVSGADTVDELTDLHRSLTEERTAERSKSHDTDQ
jgi:hypothetical protein